MDETVSSARPPSDGLAATSSKVFSTSSAPVAQHSTGDSRSFCIPDHELLGLIASGAYGEVWLARNVIGTLRAVKIVRRDRHEFAESFEREFKGLQKFEPVSRSHEGLVDILTLGLLPDEAGFFYVMELADGTAGEVTSCYQPRTLRAHLKSRGALPVDEVLNLGLKLTAALAYLHARALVHRDVKPSNVLFIGGEPKLADAGLVAPLDDARSLVGTVGYIAPEGPGTPQADLYALGKVLYEAAFGKDRQEFPTLPADIASQPEHARLLEINTIVLKACAFDHGERYRSADNFRADLELLQAGHSVKLRQRWRRCARNLTKAALALVALGIIAASVPMLLPTLLHPRVSGDGSPSKVEDANTLCERAMLIVRGDNYSAFPEAYTNFNKAVSRDPSFARPYAGLLELRLRESVPGLGPMKPEELRTIADKLQELAPDLAATHCARSILSYWNFDFPQANTLALKAIEADPEYELGHTSYGTMLLAWGRPIEARQQFEVSRRLKPSKMTIECFIAHTYYFERDYTNALSRYSRVLQIDPNHPLAWQCVGETYRALGDYTNCIDNMEKADLLRQRSSTVADRYEGLRRAIAERDARGYWEEWARRADQDPNFERYWKAVIQLKLGQTNAAFNLLNESVRIRQEPDGAAREPNLIWLLYHEYWDNVRGNSQFKDLLDKTGFTKVMLPEK